MRAGGLDKHAHCGEQESRCNGSAGEDGDPEGGAEEQARRAAGVVRVVAEVSECAARDFGRTLCLG